MTSRIPSRTPTPTPPPWVVDDANARGALAAAARRAVCCTHDALAHAALAHLAGERRQARAWADLTVSGCLAWERFRSAPPQDSHVHAAVRSITEQARPELLAMATDAVLSRAYTTAWRLRHGAVREQPDWIAICADIDAPHRLQQGHGDHAQFDLRLPDHASGDVLHARWAIMDEANAPWRVDASDRAIDRILPRERAPHLERGLDVLVHLASSSVGIVEVEPLVDAAAQRGLVIVAVDGPGAGTTHVCGSPSSDVRPWAGLEHDVLTALSDTVGRDITSQVVAVGDAGSLLAADRIVDVRTTTGRSAPGRTARRTPDRV